MCFRSIEVWVGLVMFMGIEIGCLSGLKLRVPSISFIFNFLAFLGRIVAHIAH